MDVYVLKSISELESFRKKIDGALPHVDQFPLSLFSKPPFSQAFVDYGYITSEELFGILTALCNIEDEGGFTFVMTKPDPVKYFLKHFNSLPAASFSRNDGYSAFAEFVTRDPGSSPADAIAYRSDEVMIASDTLSFVVYGSRAFDLATIATLRRPVDFWDNPIFPKSAILMDYDMAYDHLRRLSNFSGKREEFLRM
jgi:hypothetical protein